jgi:hypothetical protein
MFQFCISLPQITIPSNITSIKKGAFNGCESLMSITVKAVTPPSIQSNTFNGVPLDCTIYVPAESVEAYKAKTNWAARADYIFAIEE